MDIFTLDDLWGLAGCYATFLALPHMGIGIIGTSIILVSGYFRRNSVLPLIAATWIFAGALLLTGCFWNLIWNLSVFNHLYWSHDYAGLECSPFGLIIHGEPSSPPRFYHDMTVGKIRLLWSLYAVLSWGTAGWITALTMKITRKVEQNAAHIFQKPRAVSENGER